MSKPENVLIIDPAQELKFRGEFEMKKKFRTGEFSSANKTTRMESKLCN